MRLFYGMALLITGILAASSAVMAQIPLEPNERPKGSVAIPMRTGGRIARIEASQASPLFRSQWPAVYYEAQFRGEAVILNFGPGDAHWIIDIDGKRRISLVKPQPQDYLIDGLPDGLHRIRVQVASESMEGVIEFGGIFTAKGSKALRVPRRARQIEFIGDSFTVGYGNTSLTHECSDEEVWAATDASQGLGPRVAQALEAEFQVNAASGRGLVRNFNGFPGDTLPQIYPYLFFEKKEIYQDPTWQPQVIVINLGTNDFYMPLNPGEKWKTRDELRAEYEETFVRFIGDLRVRNPLAHFVLWGTDLGSREVMDEEAKVVARLQQAGEKRIAFVPVPGLSFGGCNSHPNVPDDARVADALLRHFATHPEMLR